MSQPSEQPTIGQEFTSRWMARRNPARFNNESLTRDITAAVDEYVKSRPEIAPGVIREVALQAAGGNETFFQEAIVEGNTVRVTARQLLRSSELVAVANRHHLAGPPTWILPV